MTFREQIRARASGRHMRIAFPEGADPRIRAAAEQVERLGIAEALLVGPGRIDPATDARLAEVATRLRERRPAVVQDGVHALDLATDPLRFAAALVALGHADGCVAGAVYSTAEVIRAALWLIGMRPETQSLSSAMYLGLPDGRILTYTDIGVIPTPSPEQLADAALEAARDRRALVGDEPIVAFLSYSSKGSATGPEVERVRQAVALFRSHNPSIVVDGELQADTALSPDVALRKAPGSPVAGRANVLIFPSLDAGNIAYKLTQRLAGATAAGPLLQGLSRPMSDLSRGAEPDDIVDVTAMVALQSGAHSA